MTQITEKSQKKAAQWRFWVPLMVQVALIVIVPLQSAVISSTGRLVTLQTAPVDPYDFLRGYSQTLNYEVSDPSVLRQLPGGQDVFPQEYGATPSRVYVILEAPQESGSPPKAWKPVRVSRDRPSSLPENQVVLQGRSEGWRIVYGLETYYMPEAQRNQLNEEIRQVGQANQQAFVVDIKVNSEGKAVPESLWIRDRKYQF